VTEQLTHSSMQLRSDSVAVVSGLFIALTSYNSQTQVKITFYFITS